MKKRILSLLLFLLTTLWAAAAPYCSVSVRWFDTAKNAYGETSSDLGDYSTHTLDLGSQGKIKWSGYYKTLKISDNANIMSLTISGPASN